MDTNGWIGVMDAAQQLGTTHLKVLMLLKQGTLKGEMVAGEWLVEPASLDCLKAHGVDLTVQASCRSACSASKCGCK